MGGGGEEGGLHGLCLEIHVGLCYGLPALTLPMDELIERRRRHWLTSEHTTLVERFMFTGSSVSSKHETFSQCCFNVGPPFATLALHWPNNVSMTLSAELSLIQISMYGTSLIPAC